MARRWATHSCSSIARYRLRPIRPRCIAWSSTSPSRTPTCPRRTLRKRYADARAVFQRFLDESPSDRELKFAIAAISMQMKDYAMAQRLLEELKAEGYGEPGVVAFYLAQIAEDTGRYDDAIARYGEVNDGERAWLAKLRIAAAMGKKGEVAAARRYLATLVPEDQDQKIQRYQADAQLLRDAGDYKAAYAVLTAA